MASVDEEAGKAKPEQLEAEVDAIRDDLGHLVGELDRRRHRAAKPLAIAAAAVAALGLGYVVWRLVRSRRAEGRRA